MSDSSFEKEVDESLREDRASSLWRKWGGTVIAALAGIVLVVAGFEVNRALTTRAADLAADQYAEASKAAAEGKWKEAGDKFARLTKSAPQGYRILAAHQYAAALLEQGKKDEAIKVFEDAAGKSKGLWSDLARLKLAYLQADEKNIAGLEEILRPLLAGKDSALKMNARDLIAAKALASGDLKRAESEYRLLKLAPDAPSGVRQSAEIGLAVIARDRPANAATGTGAGTASCPTFPAAGSTPAPGAKTEAPKAAKP